MWEIEHKKLNSRLFIGSALYPSLEIMQAAILSSKAEVVTVALRRQMAMTKTPHHFWEVIKKLNCHILPNTAGCYDVQTAITTAEMARELFETNWVKLEVMGDDYNLQPDPFGLVEAAYILVKKGFVVFPYCTDDLVLCKKLLDCGCPLLMPWGSPIGTGKGLLNPYALQVLRERLPNTLLIIDAGIGRPSHAVQAMEMGFDGILLNSAIAQANEPILMAQAFAEAIQAGRKAYEAGIMPMRDTASPSTPLLDTPFWQQVS